MRLYMRMKGEAMVERCDYTASFKLWRRRPMTARLAADSGTAAGPRSPVIVAIAAQMESWRQAFVHPAETRRPLLVARGRLSAPFIHPANCGNLLGMSVKTKLAPYAVKS